MPPTPSSRWAGTGYLTIPVFFFGWPTGEAAPVVAGASMLDALRRGLRGDFKGTRGRIALALTVVSWGMLGFVYRRNAQSQHVLREPAARGARRGLRRGRGTGSAVVGVAACIRTSWSRRQYVKKADIVRYGPHRANVADIWHRADLPRDGRAPVLLQVPGGAWAIGMRRPQAYPLMSHMAERGWVCVSIAYRVSPRNTWPAHIVDVKRALAWVKENIADYGGDPDFVAITRRFGGRASHRARGAHAERAGVAAGLRGRRHLGGGGGADLRPLRLVHPRGHRPPRVHRDPAALHRQEAVRREPAGTTWTRHRSPRCDRTRHRSSCCTARTTRSFRCGRDASSSRRSRRSRTTPSCTAEIPHAQHAFDFFGSPHGHYTATAVAHFLDWVKAKRG